MKLKRVALITATLLLISTSALSAYKYDTLACALVDYSTFVRIDTNVYVSPNTSAEDRRELLDLLAQAKARVMATYRRNSAAPIVISGRDMDSLGIFASNEYASAKFLPGRSYIVLGPKGHSVDVIAHELVHSEVFEVLGFWTRSLKLPVWFDEGVAMQVDYRKQYDAANIVHDKLAVRELRYAWQFFRDDDNQLTHHYASAKREVREWTKKVGHEGVFVLLNRMKHGERFNDVHDAMYSQQRNNNALD